MKNMTPKIEKKIVDSIENGEWTSATSSKLTDYKNIARAQLKKDQRISLRISENDLKGLQKKAYEEGIPYQTFITSILHKYLTGRIVEAK
jgi:predicted DNA binding CopG/RHH family protein